MFEQSKASVRSDFYGNTGMEQLVARVFRIFNLLDNRVHWATPTNKVSLLSY